MNAIVPLEQQIAAFAVDRGDLIHTLQNSVYPGAKKESVELALGYCAAQRLDPLQKPVHIVPMWDKSIKSMRDVIMPGIGLYRVQAARTGQHAGTSEPEFGPMVEETIEGVRVEYPEWCKVTVKRVVNGTVCDFVAVEYWRENYATVGKIDGVKSDAPNAMWKKRPRGQLAKCAEAQALRKAFPELGAAPTAEEMEGKTIEVGEPAESRPAVQQPRSRSEAKAPKATTEPLDVDPATGEVTKPADATPASAGMIAFLRKKLEAGALSEADAFKKFDLTTFDGLTVAKINEIIKWAGNPAE